MFTLEDWIVDIAFLLIIVGGTTGLVAAINDCRKEKTMTKVNVIDHKNDQYTCPEDFKEKDWFYNTLDQHHYYLMPLVDFLKIELH